MERGNKCKRWIRIEKIIKIEREREKYIYMENERRKQ